MDDYSSSGKTEFREIVEYMNEKGIGLQGESAYQFEQLRLKWNAKDKSLSDYFGMKEYHSQIAHFFL